MGADVPEARTAKDGVDDRVCQDVAVAVAHGAAVGRDRYTADDHRASFHQRVGVEAYARARLHDATPLVAALAASRTSATATSEGVVTLMLSSLPGKRRTS